MSIGCAHRVTYLKGRLARLNRLQHLSKRLSCREHHVRLAQLVDDLLRRMSISN